MTSLCRRLGLEVGLFVGWYLSRLYRRLEGQVVLLVLVGIGDRELANRTIERFALPQVVGDQSGVSRSGMGSRQGPSAKFRIPVEPPWRCVLHISGAFHVLELTPVILMSGLI